MFFWGRSMAAGPECSGVILRLPRTISKRALRINRGKFLMTYVYYARSVCGADAGRSPL